MISCRSQNGVKPLPKATLLKEETNKQTNKKVFYMHNKCSGFCTSLQNSAKTADTVAQKQ